MAITNKYLAKQLWCTLWFVFLNPCGNRLCVNHEIHLQNRCDPVMTAYKLVTVDAPYWGFGYRLEQALIAVTPLFSTILETLLPIRIIGENKCPNFSWLFCLMIAYFISKSGRCKHYLKQILSSNRKLHLQLDYNL